MRRTRRAALAALIAGWIALPSAPSWALEGRVPGGVPFLTGGVGAEERELLAKRRNEFNLWITTAARQSGAYLAAVRVTVRDAAKRPVLDIALDGPLLLVRLAPGQYTVEASVERQTQQKAVSIAPQGHREVYFYFDVAAETGPQEPAPKPDAPRPKR